jgi:2-polyprenyl-3-methyl-5-hydroxy-6-metoxy-1,4-benzoquinol methylase
MNRPPDFDDKPLIDTEAVPACPVCGSTSFATFAEGYDYELLTCRNEWRFVRCDACGHVWLNPRPAISTLGVIYPPTYYAYNYKQQINPIAVKGKQFLDRGKMKSIIKQLPREPGSFLDVGCGDGRFLRAMHERGLAKSNIYGLELDENVVAPLAADGYRAYCRRMEDCTEIAPSTIDLATMFHVIEHVDDPGAVVRKVASWLTPGGVFAIETPNVDSLDAQKFKPSFWGGYHIPRHWNLFNPSTLKRLLNDNGLKVIATSFQTGHSFWMYSYQHTLNYGPRPRKGLARWFNPLKSLPMLVGFTLFDKFRATLGARTSAMLMLAQKVS